MPMLSQGGLQRRHLPRLGQGQERLQAVAARLRSALRSSRPDRRPGGPPLQPRRARQSLMLLKPAGGVPHVGGVLTQPGEPYYEMLRPGSPTASSSTWTAPRVAQIEVCPQSAVAAAAGMKQQMAVIATYADGSVRDVTRRGVHREQQHRGRHGRQAGPGHRRAPRRGRHAGPLRRRLRRRARSSSWATAAASPGRTSPSNNYIDDAGLRQAEVGQGPAERAVHRRRLHPPRLSRPDRPAAGAGRGQGVPRRRRGRRKVKRDELIDKLVGSPDFVEHWTNKWADLLQVNRKFLGERGPTAFRN